MNPTEVPIPTRSANLQSVSNVNVVNEKSDESDGLGMIMIIAIAGVAGLCVIFGILVMLYLLRGRSKNNAHASAGNPSVTGDNVVMGRPVAGDANAIAEEAPAAAGTPVAPAAGKDTNAADYKL